MNETETAHAPTFTYAVGTFNGPLDVLLELVEKRKLFINEVSLASVADAYIAYIQEHTTTLLYRAEFIAIAATLVLIKSRSLLPDFSLTEDEEAQIGDLQFTLERYAAYKKAVKTIERVWGKQVLIPFRKDPPRDVGFAPSRDCTPAHINTALEEMLRATPVFVTEHPKAVVQKTVSIEEMIDRIKTRIVSGTSHVSFRTAASGNHRGDVIVLFLALLELVKLGVVNAEQHDHQDDILMTQHHD